MDVLSIPKLTSTIAPLSSFLYLTSTFCAVICCLSLAYSTVIVRHYRLASEVRFGHCDIVDNTQRLALLSDFSLNLTISEYTLDVEVARIDTIDTTRIQYAQRLPVEGL